MYLSATIDKTDDFEYYSRDIRQMIELNYLCDYTIHVPIFTEDPTSKNICEYLLKNLDLNVFYKHNLSSAFFTNIFENIQQNI